MAVLLLPRPAARLQPSSHSPLTHSSQATGAVLLALAQSPAPPARRASRISSAAPHDAALFQSGSAPGPLNSRPRPASPLAARCRKNCPAPTGPKTITAAAHTTALLHH